MEKRGKTIGLTGLYCAGKNRVAAFMEGRGIPVLDVDKLGHTAIEEERDAILRRFGAEVLGDAGMIDRRKLGVRVFGDSGELAALQAIVHPAANRLTEQWLREREGRRVVINAALLHKSSVFGKLDAIILIKAPFFVRFIRALRRDHLPWKEVFRRFRSQRDFMAQYQHIKNIKENADIHIVNNGLFGKPEKYLDDILERIG
jgi:dephospho-CoA kinase